MTNQGQETGVLPAPLEDFEGMKYAYTSFQKRTLRARCYHCAVVRSVKIFCLETRIRTTIGILHDNIYLKTQRMYC